MIILMILSESSAAHKIRSRIKIMSKSKSYLISAAPKYGWSFSGIAIDPSGR